MISEESIVLQYVFRKIADSLDGFKEVGDDDIKYDLVHTALSWSL